MLLRAKLSSGNEDLSAFESRLFDDSGLQRAHSSPSLPQDAAAAKEKTRGSKTSKSLKVTSSSSLTSKTDGSVREGSKKKNGGGKEPPLELQRQSSKQEEAG